jgi:hypothetical protein
LITGRPLLGPRPHALRDRALVTGRERRRILCQGVFRTDLEQAVLCEQAQRACMNGQHEPLHLALSRRWRLLEDERAVRTTNEPAIQADQMMMGV